ncbi:HEPN domain-containing protein [Glutamicibacter sp. 0426]|uniref:HEPN domain-containing protein n=1 Tax=Glutamicibacter sp. 0426 TaxID=1913445 RepID=UPI001160FE40|nr:HEPN domain-containing protein [Glutamicibacter sp. 0426]
MEEHRPVLLGMADQNLTTPAVLSLDNGCYTLRPERWIEEPQQVKINRRGADVISIELGNRLGEVADFQPRVLWGVDNGRPFTVLDARMTVELDFNFDWPSQIYKANHILWDAHISGFDSPALAVRVALPIRGLGWPDQETLLTDAGRIGAWSDSNRPGLVWEPAHSNSVRKLTQEFPKIVTTLLQLWTGKETSACSLEVRIKNLGWCTIKSTDAPANILTQPLLPLNKLTLSVVSRWLTLVPMLGPVPFMAIHDGAPLQSDAQMLATALEGLHRRLHPDAKRFHMSVSEGLLRRARRAASKAAVEVLSDVVEEADARAAYNEALGHMGELSYSARLAELLPRIESVAPGLLGPSQLAWIKDMKDLRNIQSHGLKNHDEFGDAEVGQYYVLVSSGRWVLKILLLLELLDQEQIWRALRASDRFMYSLANIDREKYWKDFSAYEKFLATVKND